MSYDIQRDIDSVYMAAVSSIDDIKYGRISAENIFILVTQLMIMVERYPELTGGQKEQIVVGVLKKTVEASDLDENERHIVNVIIDRTAPVVIDRIIRASKGEFDLNKVAGFFKSVWLKIKCC